MVCLIEQNIVETDLQIVRSCSETSSSGKTGRSDDAHVECCLLRCKLVFVFLLFANYERV